MNEAVVKYWLQQYGKNLGFSLGLHILLFGFLLLSVETTFNANQVPSKKGEIVQAAIVDEQKVTEEIQRLKSEEIQHKVQEQEQQKLAAQKLEQVKKQQEQEKAKLEQLKQDMAKAKQEEQDKLAEIKRAKEKEQKQLETLKSEKQSEQKRLAALDDQRQAEQDRVKQLRLEREKEEKKKAQLAAKQQAESRKKAEDTKRLAGEKTAREAQRLAAENQRVMSELQRIVGIWKEKIQSNKRVATGMESDLKCVVAIKVLPDGSVNAKLVQSSGNPAYDELMINAIYKSQPYELSEDPLVKEQLKDVEISFKNEEGVG